ncbi:S-layer homology domain-containing protein [Paenibacillus flagellatus]|nr:S-layer homology domain-containing protein [Paenibacillus flagellatus]
MTIAKTLACGVALTAALLLGAPSAGAADWAKAESARFTDSHNEKGKLYGTVEFKPPANAAGITDYAVYFTDSKGRKIRYVGNVNVKEQEEFRAYTRSMGFDFTDGYYGLNIENGTALPPGADSFGIFAKNADGESDSGAIVYIWDRPVSLVTDVSFADENPKRGLKGAIRWKAAPGFPGVTGYRLTYFNGTDWLPLQVPESLLAPGKEAYDIPFDSGDFPARSAFITLKVAPLTSGGGDAPAGYADMVDDISGETSGIGVKTSGTPKLSELRFTDTDERPGLIGGQFRFEADDESFLKKDYSTGGSPFVYSLYFLDASNRKLKGLISKAPYEDAAGYYYYQIPKGTAVPKGAAAIGAFAELPAAEGVDFGKVELRDYAGNDLYAQDVRFIDANPAPGVIEGKLTWKASPHEEELRGYALFAGDDAAPFATVDKGASPYEAAVPALLTAPGSLKLSVIPIAADGTYRYSVNFKDGTTNLADTAMVSEGFEAGQTDRFAGYSSSNLFKDDDPRPGYIGGLMNLNVYGDPGQGSADIYFYDRYGKRIAKLGQLTYSGRGSTGSVYFTVPEGTAVPADALYIGRSAPGPEGKPNELAAFLNDNSLQNKVTFKDVKTSEAGSLYSLMTQGILTGFEDGTFRPHDTVTRAQFAAIASRFFKLPAETYANSFRDVDADDWYAGAVAAAVANGLLEGYEDGTFRPDRTITHREMYVMMYRALAWRYGGQIPDLDPSYQDTIVSQYTGGKQYPDWLKPAVAWLYLNGMMYKSGDLKVDENVTREDCANMFGRFMQPIY